jgi:hypothetical protein
MKHEYGFEDWLQHMHTERLLNKAEQQLRLAHKELLEACGKSMDAEVRGALIRYQGLADTVSMLKGHQKERHEDE